MVVPNMEKAVLGGSFGSLTFEFLQNGDCLAQAETQSGVITGIKMEALFLRRVGERSTPPAADRRLP